MTVIAITLGVLIGGFAAIGIFAVVWMLFLDHQPALNTEAQKQRMKRIFEQRQREIELQRKVKRRINEYQRLQAVE